MLEYLQRVRYDHTQNMLVEIGEDGQVLPGGERRPYKKTAEASVSSLAEARNSEGFNRNFGSYQSERIYVFVDDAYVFWNVDVQIALGFLRFRVAAGDFRQVSIRRLKTQTCESFPPDETILLS